MKRNTYNMICYLGILMFFFSCKANSQAESDIIATADPVEYQDIREQLQGTWLLQENSKSKLVFTSDEVFEYYNGEFYKTYLYTISETSPQCGEKVSMGSKFIYIKWTNVKDSNDVYCYEINTLSDLRLALVYLGGPNFQPTVYKKVQK